MPSIEPVQWVAEAQRPISIVNNKGFQYLMKTGQLIYELPSAQTANRDVFTMFEKCKEQVGKMLQVSMLFLL